MGWRDRQKSLLLPVAGEIFLLTLPFIERPYRTSEVLVRDLSGFGVNQDLSLVSSRFTGIYAPWKGGLYREALTKASATRV
jgi:hypothetical protein